MEAVAAVTPSDGSERVELVAQALHRWNGYAPEDYPWETKSEAVRESYIEEAEYILSVLDGKVKF